MKRFPFLQMVIAALLLVTAVGCTTVREVYSEEEDGYYTDTRRSAPARIYVDDPYYGTMVLERDPYSGRYYPLASAGFNSRYQDPRYRNNYDPYWGNTRRGYYSGGGGYRYPTNRVTQQQSQQQQQQAAEQRRQAEQKKTEARKRLFNGGGN